jgi:uncharacterized protein
VVRSVSDEYPSLVVDVSALRHRTGATAEIRRSVVIDDLAITTASVRDGRVDVDLGVENVVEGVVVSGKVRAIAEGECRRCLEPVSETIDLSVREIFEQHPTDGETWPIVDDHLDLEPMIRESVLLALPLAPLCREDCLGPQPDRFPTTGPDDRPDDTEPTVDPRWAALSDLKLDE